MAVWVEGLIGDFVALDPLQEVIHHILPVPFRVVRTRHLHLLESQEEQGPVTGLPATALLQTAPAK